MAFVRPYSGVVVIHIYPTVRTCGRATGDARRLVSGVTGVTKQSDARSACISSARHARDRDDASGMGDSVVDASAAFVLHRTFTQAARPRERQQSFIDALRCKHSLRETNSSRPSVSGASRARSIGCFSDTGTKPHVSPGTSFTCRRRHRHKAASAASDGRGCAEGGRAKPVEQSTCQR